MSRRKPRIFDIDLILYHWSPSVNRDQILQRGLVPGMRCRTAWDYRPNYICFSASPSAAWGLSAGMDLDDKVNWDLWMTRIGNIDNVAVNVTDKRWVEEGIDEVRVCCRVKKSQLWYVGRRTANKRGFVW